MNERCFSKRTKQKIIRKDMIRKSVKKMIVKIFYNIFSMQTDHFTLNIGKQFNLPVINGVFGFS